MMHAIARPWMPFAIGFVLLAPVAAAAQTPLPLGSTASGTTSSETPAEYTVRAETAGVLTVVVHGVGDLSLYLVDEDGQTMPDGSADGDLNGSLGTELLSTTIATPGAYRLQVRTFDSGSGTFQIAASFLPFPALERPADPDRRPSLAQAITIGEPHEDRLDSGDGDLVDWFVMTPAESGTLTVITRAAGGDDLDLALEAFLDGNFTEPVDHSDQDRQDNTANEAVTVSVTAGQPVHIRVSGVFQRVAGRYEVSSSLIRTPDRGR